jgi:hypothetical protein
VTHSEYNPSATEPVHFLQIWIVPARRGLEPAYAQHAFDRRAAADRLLVLAAGAGVGDGIALAQDARVLVGLFGPTADHRYPLASGHQAWVHVARGAITLNGTTLGAGDGAGVSEESELRLARAAPDSEVLVFDLG